MLSGSLKKEVPWFLGETEKSFLQIFSRELKILSAKIYRYSAILYRVYKKKETFRN